ncbi:MAG TPA: PrgI family protein [Candidatus Paceibacterota bacterium]|nr:PrgI family protein [Candidatus Paceibacterota bacterium]
MQFQVPQFIEVEDKIFGPLTFKQFVYIAGSAGLSYLLWRTLPIFVAAPLIMGFLGLGASLAFFKYNGQPFILAIEHAFFYFIRSKLYLWSSETVTKPKTPVQTPQQMVSPDNVYVPKLSESRLHELAWSLDIKERIAAGTADETDRTQAPQDHVVIPIRTARDALVR